MTDKEINIAILQELKRIANEIFTNEIEIEPGTYTAAELAKEKSAKGDVVPDENQPFAVVPDIAPPPLSRADAPGVPSACVPLLDAVSFALWFAVRVWVVSARGTVPAPAANIGCSRRESVRIRGATRRTTAPAERLKNEWHD